MAEKKEIKEKEQDEKGIKEYNKNNDKDNMGNADIKKRGKFIVICGGDGSGKATQTELLAKRLKKEGFDAETISFPQYGQKSAALVEEYLNGRYGTADIVGPYRASVFYACDRFAASSNIYEWLCSGKTVLANRYISANLGHQGGKIRDPKERERFWRWIENLEYNIFGIPKADANIYLHVPAEISQQLVDSKGARAYTLNKRDIHEADLEHLKNAEEAYLQLVGRRPGEWIKIECTFNEKIMGREDIHALIWDKVKKILGR